MSLRIHHLNCGSMCPIGRRIMEGQGGWLERGCFVCHCLLIESEQGLILVDTGIGTQDIARGLGKLMDLSTRPAYSEQETAEAQVRALGFQPSDVRHILVTHLDLDHAGGLADFPRATVHVFQDELQQALGMRNFNARLRYLPRQWAHGVNWQSHETKGESWFGFGSIRALPGTLDEVLMVPLAGHSVGHCGVAVRAEGGRWLLHAGDAFFHRAQMDPQNPKIPLGIRIFQNTMATNRRERDRNIARLRDLCATASEAVQVFCAHDPQSFAELSGC